ncbi:hypothetical protein ACFFU2_04170 [Halomonas alkalicola]|uniref:Transmembrane protein n=1 Tax=Halomonas alkalicola TaxID=1930622 RepID=A0ABY9H5T7_9GAMM|nr:MULTISPECIES: hypothetical protein [Halomonas]QJQ98946.1 hypothetical protein HIR79_09740 [Halomonas sp. PGE1]WLI73819.1 hypothetical protein B6N23_02465 [Halomonas alkalicola]
MPKVRHYADLVTVLSGLSWLVVYWSISLTAQVGSIEPTLAALLMLGALVLVSFVHRPIRVLLRRYHVRKRRTEMWMHILALPLTLAFFFGIVIESMLAPLNGPQKMLLFNVFATAGWLVFVVTVLIKLAIHQLRRRNSGNGKAEG